MNIQATLVKHNGNKSAAARELGISRHKLLRLVGSGFRPKRPRNIFVLPDCQVKPGVPLEHLSWAGQFVADKRPDLVVCLGDFADMPSLSSFDRGKKSFEGRRYRADIEAAHDGMERFMTPIIRCEGYDPERHMLIGNHEYRIVRAVEDDSRLDGTIGIHDLGFEAWGWNVHEYRTVLELDGVAFSHFFYNPNTSKPYGGTAHSKLKNIGLSFVMGHQQGIDIAMRELPNGKKQHGIVAGSFYQHEEDYRGPQANNHWHGCLMLFEVADGSFDLMQVSLDFLRRKYG